MGPGGGLDFLWEWGVVGRGSRALPPFGWGRPGTLERGLTRQGVWNAQLGGHLFEVGHSVFW